MKQALINMLNMQHRMNTRVHPQWVEQRFEWYRALWIECGELMDHYGYKWWKKQQADLPQVQLEVVDIWHFGMSALFHTGRDIEGIAQHIVDEVKGRNSAVPDVREATEALAENALATKGFSPALFWDLLEASQMSFEQLYRAYVGKNVLNFFRQDHGYQDGSYVKQWAGREDNEHLVELVAGLETGAEDFAEQLYQALSQRYQQVTAGN